MGQKKKILFATFTNSLVNSASHLLKQLVPNTEHDVIFSTMHQLAADILKKAGDINQSTNDSLRRGIFYQLFSKGKIDLQKTGYGLKDINFLDREMEWIIYGNNIKTLDEYLWFERVGMDKILGKTQRKNLWSIFTIYNEHLEKNKKLTPRKIFIRALDHLENYQPIYDYVFLDEVQDLTPTAIKFALKLCKNPKKIFIAADVNQSIYGKGVTWKSIDQELKFYGKSTHIKKNYRVPREIMIAISGVMDNLTGSDAETLAEESVYSGDFPSITICSDIDDEIRRIEKFIDKSLAELCLSYESVGILCPSNDFAEKISKKFSPEFDAKFLGTKSNILAHKGIKLMTIHAAKGLQFPIVIIPHLVKDTFPPNINDGGSAEEFDQKQRRVFFVACTRAMKKLLITSISDQQSDYFKYFDNNYWQYI